MSSHQIELDLDMDNELVFKVSVEGTSPAPARTRFMVETKDFSLVFPAESSSDGEVSISIPKLENVIKEGSYSGILEVIVDDRVFVQIEIDTKFSKSVRVVAEAVTRRRATKVTAGDIVKVNPSRKKKISESNMQNRPAVSPNTSKNKITSKQKAAISRALVIERRIRAFARKRNISLTEDQGMQIQF